MSTPPYKVSYTEGKAIVGRFFYTKSDAYNFAKEKKPAKVFENGKSIRCF